MKYTIEGFDQELLVKWGLDSNDAIILRWFVDFYHSGKMAKVEHEGETYLWVNYQTCIDDLPIMRIKNKQVLARHFKKMVSCGLMKHHLSKDGGVYTCFKLVESQYSKLIENQTSSQPLDLKVDRGQLKSQKGIDSKVETKDSSINNPSIKDTTTPQNVNGKLTHDNYKLKVKGWFKDNAEKLKTDHFPLWIEAYPDIIVHTQINKAYSWLLNNPEKQRSKFVSFLNNWLCRAQNDYEEKHSK